METVGLRDKLTCEPTLGSLKNERQRLLGAIARGWCHTETGDREMDSVLAEAICQEVEQFILADKSPRLGCATTGLLIAELCARADLYLNYRTIDD